MIDKLIGPITGLLDKFIPDADTKAKLAHSVATMAQEHAQELAKAQLEVNKVEAAHKSLFVAGWRPAVGWVCVLGMFGNFITIPFSNFVLALLELNIVIPLVPLETMMPGRESFRVFLDRHRGGIKPNDHGNPNPLLRILPALYEGNFTVGQALAILFSGSPSDLSEEAVENALSTYLEPTDKAIEAISLVLGFPSDSVQDQIFQHNAVADPSRALEDENPYAEAGPSQKELLSSKSAERVYDKQ